VGITALVRGKRMVRRGQSVVQNEPIVGAYSVIGRRKLENM
jgi:hypothetical protein